MSHGVPASKVIYANPCKQTSHLKFAASAGVNLMTFDNHEELQKIKRFYPDANLVLRILTDDSRSLCKLGLKFGAALENVKNLLLFAKQLSLNVIGIRYAYINDLKLSRREWLF